MSEHEGLTEAEAGEIVSDDIGYWIRNPFTDSDAIAAKAAWWIGRAYAAGLAGRDDLIDTLRSERNAAVLLAEEREADYLAEVADHDQTKRLLRHSQRVAGKAIQRTGDPRPAPRPIPGVPHTNSPRPCRRAWCRGRKPHSLVNHWFGWVQR